MNFDEYSKNRLLGMDDASLKALAKQIADAAGASGLRTNMLINDPNAIRRMLASLTASDAEKMLSKASEAQKREINRIVGEL